MDPSRFSRQALWLGSTRLSSSPTGTSRFVSSVAYAPFGETYAASPSNADVSFTGQNPDTSAGDYDFLFREYSTQGRWASPDPAGLAAVDPSNPQSWNRYAYVLNNPMNIVDPLGLSDCPDDKFSCGDNSGTWGFDNCEGAAGVDLFGGGGTSNAGACNGPCQSDFSLGMAHDCGNGFADGGLPKCPDGVWAWAMCIDSNGHIAGSNDGEIYCNGDICSIWSAAAHAWFPCVQGSYCQLPFYSYATGGGGGGGDSAKQLAHAINATDVQSLGNPCTVAAWYGASFIGGSGAAAVMNTSAIGATASTYWPNAVEFGHSWLYHQSLTGGTIAFALARLPQTINTVKKTAAAGIATLSNACNAMQ